jgi:hypothetical protein
VIISTRIHYESGDRTWSVGENVGAAGGDVGGVTLSPGSWTLTVHRAGIGATGYKKLLKALKLRTRQRSQPTGSRVETPARPTILVTHKVEGVNVTFTVTGQGFLANQPKSPQGITIRIVSEADPRHFQHYHTGSDANGAIRAEIGPLDVRWVRQNGRVHISATDSRKDPNSVPANDPLWSEPPVPIDL